MKQPITIDVSDKRIYNKWMLPIIAGKYNDCRYFVAFGGRGGGKSKGIIQGMVIGLLSLPFMRLVIIRKVYDTVKDSIYKEMVDQIEEWGISHLFKITKSPLYIECKHNKNAVLARGLDRAEKIKSLKDPTHVVIDEADQMSETDLRMIDGSLRTLKAAYLQIYMLLNTTIKSHWLYKRFIDGRSYETGKTVTYENTVVVEGAQLKTKVALLHLTYKQNRFVSKSFVAYLEGLINLGDDQLTYKMDTLGEFVDAVKGQIWPNWKEVSELPEIFDDEAVGIDVGWDHPTAIHKIRRSGRDLTVDERFYKRHRQDHEIVEFIESDEAITNKIPIVVDSSAPQLVSMLKERGYNVMAAKKGDGSVYNGCMFVRSFNLHYTTRSQAIKKEKDTYRWKTKPNGELVLDSKGRQVPVKINDDACDSIRMPVWELWQAIDLAIGKVRGALHQTKVSRSTTVASPAQQKIITGYCELFRKQQYEKVFELLNKSSKKKAYHHFLRAGFERYVSQLEQRHDMRPVVREINRIIQKLDKVHGYRSISS